MGSSHKIRFRGVFKIMTNKYKYILIGDKRTQELANKKSDIKLSGLYQWSETFQTFGEKGVVDNLWRKEDLEDFDIIHINYTPSNIQLPTMIRDQLGDSSSTKLVINVDYDISLMSASWAYHVNIMIKELRMADVLFHVEPKGAEVLGHMLNRDIKINPHPVDVSGLYDFIKGDRLTNPEWSPFTATIFHRYTASTLPQYISQKNLPLRRVLFGYQPIGKQAVVANCGMFDQILMYMPFQEYVEEISKALLGCDLYSGYSYGRVTIEMAGLCVPAVVSSTIGASHLFPYTTVDPFDTRKAEDLFQRLISDSEFANLVVKTAHERCSVYSLKNSYSRFVEMIEE